MPQPLEYNESRGSMPDYLSIFQSRIKAAQEELARAGTKPEALRAAALSNAEEELKLAQEEYKRFINDNPQAKQYQKPESIN